MNVTPAPDATVRPKRSWLGIVGLAVGFVGFGLSVFGPEVVQHVAPQPPRKELSDTLAEAAVKFRQRMRDGGTASPAHQDAVSWRRPSFAAALRFAALGGGFAAVLLGCVGWLRGEDLRFDGSAVSIGLIALAWQQILIAIGVAVAVLLFGALISALGGGS